ncbi:putative protein kinase domain-containing protein [Rosellinia necatrix]|uniref:Protein kinase domain-containing protein n=1 Tax=Rosellinia necatrix TaxID=77044 RepID=A0A1W2TV63_ROSNE|nr:putative protein kinase domain-containing protein [Rosellinia necatrix]
MDIKPSNVVISANSEVTLIDISGRVFSQDWLSPEMRHLQNSLSQDFFSQVLNDTWAFGKIVSQMVSASCDDLEKGLLRSLALDCTAPVSQRSSLRDIITKLESDV